MAKTFGISITIGDGDGDDGGGGGGGGGGLHYCPSDRGKFGVHKLPYREPRFLCGPERAIICVMASRN